jgi:multicomponent Na+:H+ antiporter subunit E
LKYAAGLILALFTLWLLWSGHYTPLLLSLGVVSSVLVLSIAMRMKVVDQEIAALRLVPRSLLYVPWLLWEVVKANVDVARRILNPKLPINPRVIRVKTGQKQDLGRVIYANSITLTPGTVSIDTEGHTITVHALTKETAEGLETGEMDRRVTRLEGLE